jgi:nucleoside-diphosphate-sugar epimerase
MNKKIKITLSILGCGWLGMPLAESLLKKGYSVNGSTTSEEKIDVLKKKGIDPFYMELTEARTKGETFSFLNGAEVLIIDIPPGLRKNPDSDFVKKMEHFITKIALSSVEKVIFISSTTVFKDDEVFSKYNEASAPNGTSSSAKQLQEVERLLQKNANFKTTVIRMGGLLGESRHPVKFLAGRENIKSPNAPVNLIQQKDCIALIEKVLDKDSYGETYHGVFPSHPSKKEYYQATAKEMELALLDFDEVSKSIGKQVSSAITQERLGFKFNHNI